MLPVCWFTGGHPVIDIEPISHIDIYIYIYIYIYIHMASHGRVDLVFNIHEYTGVMMDWIPLGVINPFQ